MVHSILLALTSARALSAVFDPGGSVAPAIFALTSARALSAVFDPGGSVAPAVGRSNGSVTNSLVISETRELWRILT